MAPDSPETTQEPVAVWLRNPRTGMVNLVVHPETMRRCLSDGHTVAADPRLPVSSAEHANTSTPTPESTPDPDTVAAVQHAQVEATITRNNAAREAFGVSPVQPPAKPEKSERATRRPSAKRGA